jgi:hypothetical protein
MPIFGSPLGADASFFQFDWENWSDWRAVQQSGTTPAPILWTASDGCKEKFQMVPVFIENPET